MISTRISLAVAAALSLAVVLGSPAVCHAQIPLDVGISVKGGPNVSGLTEPGDKTFSGNPYVGYVYPGFVGVGGGVGLFVEPRVLDLVGIEFGLIWEKSSGTGEINDQNITLKSTDLIIPLHVRVATPGLVKFVFGFGADFVLGQSADASGPPAYGAQGIEREFTTHLGAGLGLEIDAVVVKIPIEFRYRWCPDIEDDLSPRLDVETLSTRYGMKANWEHQGEVFLGVKYVVDVL